MTLTEFLTARIADREQALDDAMYYTLPDGTRIRPNVEPGEDVEVVKAKIFRQELAECEAKRRIVGLHAPYDSNGEPDCSSCGDVPQVAYPCATLLALALPYAAHADYDEAWRP